MASVVLVGTTLAVGCTHHPEHAKVARTVALPRAPSKLKRANPQSELENPSARPEPEHPSPETSADPLDPPAPSPPLRKPAPQLDFAKRKKVLLGKWYSGNATSEEMQLLRAICRADGDRSCIWPYFMEPYVQSR